MDARTYPAERQGGLVQCFHVRIMLKSTTTTLVLRSTLLRASRRTATSEIVPAAILRSRAKNAASWMRSEGVNAMFDMIGFME